MDLNEDRFKPACWAVVPCLFVHAGLHSGSVNSIHLTLNATFDTQPLGVQLSEIRCFPPRAGASMSIQLLYIRTRESFFSFGR